MSATPQLRYRGHKTNFVELAKTLDAFKKVPEKFTETTEIGGTLSLLSCLLIVFLIYKEVQYYWDAELIYQFEPDIDMDETVQMHVDITIAMTCSSLSGVDLMDETQQDVFAYGTLQREGTFWQMTPDKRLEFERTQHMNAFLREEYHSVAHVIFKDIIRSNEVHSQESGLSGKKPVLEEQYDACRLYGTLGINKVAGVLHLIGGAQPVVGLFEDQLLIEFRRVPVNFTHRINRLSFGQFSRHIVQPLEGDETFVADEATIVQYFLKIVPTVIHNAFSTINTYQYSVSEHVRTLDSGRNSYGSPGIYFKYDWSALKIIVRTDRENIVQFVIRQCSVIAGIIVISGLLNSFLLFVQKLIVHFLAPQTLCRLPLSDSINKSSLFPSLSQKGNTKTRGAIDGGSQFIIVTPVNDLISTANQMSNLAAAVADGAVPITTITNNATMATEHMLPPTTTTVLAQEQEQQ